MDPLSDVLSLLKPRSYLSGGFDLGGDWSIDFRKYQGIKCYAVVSGQCWLSVESLPNALHMGTGDCFLLPRGRAFRLANNLQTPSVDSHMLLASAKNGGVLSFQGGGSCFLVGGYFTLLGSHADILLDKLPPVVHLRTDSDKAALRWSLDRMREEVLEQRPGGLLVTQHLAYTMLIQALRLFLEGGLGEDVGWLFALADKQLSAAINAMHENPAHRWTLQALAKRSGMSRSVFAARFKETVGSSAMEYLTRWRMLLAGDKLMSSHDSISTIALSLGYESESAFRKVFRKIMGCSPRQYAGGCNREVSLHDRRKAVSPLHPELVVT